MDYFVLRNQRAPAGMRCLTCGKDHGPLYTRPERERHAEILVIDADHNLVEATLLDPPSFERTSYRARLADGTEVKVRVQNVTGVTS